MAVAGAGAGAEIMAKVGAGAENKYIRLRNTGIYSPPHRRPLCSVVEPAIFWRLRIS